MVGLGLLITTIYMFRETLSTARRHPLSLKTYALHAIQLMSCPVFMGNMGLICLSSASFFVFIAEFPFALHQLRLSESMMGPLLIPQTIVFMVAGVLSAAMSRRFGKSRSLWYVTWLAILGSLILWAVVAFTPLTSIWQILIPYALTAFSNGAIYPLAFSAIFEAHDDKAGTAAGWVAFYMGLMGFVGAFLMGVFNEAGVVGMALLILVFYGLCLGAWALTACFIERHVAE
jgi:MFS family permease